MKQRMNNLWVFGAAALTIVASEQSVQAEKKGRKEAPAGKEIVTGGKVSKLYKSDPIPSTTPPDSFMDPSSNAYIVFDGSGSMGGKPIQEAKRAVKAFVADAPEELNIGLFVFDSKNRGGREVVPLGSGDEQRKKLNQVLGKVSAGGGTPLGAAIQTGTTALIAQFQKQLRYGDVRLIVVTDGHASDVQRFSSSIAYANSHHVPIYTIGFHIKNDHPLRNFSEAYFTASDEKELLGAMKETLAELDDSVNPDF